MVIGYKKFWGKLFKITAEISVVKFAPNISIENIVFEVGRAPDMLYNNSRFE